MGSHFRTFRLGFRTLRCIVLLVAVALTQAQGATLAGASTAGLPPDPSVHGMGAKAPLYVFSPPPAEAPAATLPASVDLSPWAPAVGNQDGVGSCVAWAIEYGQLGWYWRHAGLPGDPFAPMYSYSQINFGVDGGSFPSDALRLEQQRGADTQADYYQGNYDWWDQPTPAEQANAQNYQTTGFRELFAGPNQGQAGITAIETELAAGRPVAITLPVRPGFDSLTTGVDTDITGSIRGSHEVLALGYSSTGLWIQNQWGTGWGNQGRGWLGWDVIGADVDDANVINGISFQGSPVPGAAVPGAPTSVTAAAGTAAASVSWAPPPNGGSVITGYTVTASPGGMTATTAGATSATVSGLANGHTYTFTVSATNSAGTGPASPPSNAVTPASCSGGGTLSNLTVFDSANAANWSLESNLQVGNQGWEDRTYTLASIPAALLGVPWIRPVMASKTAVANPLLSFAISSSTTVSVAVDIRLGRRSWMDSTWVDTGTQVVDSEATPSHLEVFSKPFAAGTVSLGPNLGPGSTYVQYLVFGSAAGSCSTVAAAPGNISAGGVSGANGQAADVSWTAPGSTGGCPITGYTVTARPGGATATVGGGSTVAVVTGLSAGTSYMFDVTAANCVGTGPAGTIGWPYMSVGSPAAPTNVIASASGGGATISWTRAASGGYPIDHYTVSASPGGATATACGECSTATLASLSNGTYTFTVTATSLTNGPASAPSNPITIGPVVTVPGAPSNVVATPGNTTAFVNWDPPASDGGASITAYTLTASDGHVWPVDPNSDLPFTATSLTNGATYTFSVTATNSVGAGPASTSSNSVTPLSTITVPGAPTNLTASAGNTTANLTWTPPPSGGTPINGYAISSTPGGLTWGISPGSTSFTATGLTNGTTYQFTITASNGMGSGPASAPSNPVTPSGAGTVSNLKVYDTSNAASWSIQGNLQVSNLGWGDRPYTLKSIPAGLLGSQWLRTSMLSKTWNNGSMLVSFSIRSQMTVSVAVDTRLGRRPWMDSSWVDSGTQIVDSESTPSHLEVFQKVFPAGTVSLGPNAGSGSTYIQYLVAAQ